MNSRINNFCAYQRFLGITLILTILTLTGCSKTPQDKFKQTDSGKALYSCVSSGGKLTVAPLGTEKNSQLLNVTLTKTGQEISLHLLLNSELNQVELKGGSIVGQENASLFTLVSYLENTCNSEVAEKISPDTFKTVIFISQQKEKFKQTEPGKALYSCVSSGGNLTVTPSNLELNNQLINTSLTKSGREVNLQFLLNDELNQAELKGAAIRGQDGTNMLALVVVLELMCSSEVARKIAPETFNMLMFMGSLNRIFGR